MNPLRRRLIGLCQKVKETATYTTRHHSFPKNISYFISPHTAKTRFHKVPLSITNSRCSSTSSILERFPIAMRDACACDMCIDPHSGQKNFKTSDIPLEIKAKGFKTAHEGLEIEWSCDVPGFETHKSYIPYETISSILSPSPTENQELKLWNQITFEENFQGLHFDYHDYLRQENHLHQVVNEFKRWGIVFLTGVPPIEKAVEDIGLRLGPIRNTFYGKTWDVKSIPKAKNVAYTDKFLGLHQDLLYMENPPAIQLLHCIENTCKGGNSLFSDGFKAATELLSNDYDILSAEKITYHYQKAGQNYRHSHLVFENNLHSYKQNGIRVPIIINYSPPFQAPFPMANRDTDISSLVHSLQKFAQNVESAKNLFECNLKPGNCVIFNNRRVLHGRRAFEAQKGGRWLKGCYVDHDVFLSRSRILQKVKSESHSKKTL